MEALLKKEIVPPVLLPPNGIEQHQHVATDLGIPFEPCLSNRHEKDNIGYESGNAFGS